MSLPRSQVPASADYDVQKAFQRQDDQIDRSSPYAQFEYVDVVFATTANLDTEIRHTLRVVDPEDIDYQVVRSTLPTIVYHDNSADRRSWGKGYLILRATAASAVVTLLLTVRNT